MKTEDCRHWKEELGAYALGHLSREERAGVEAHLEGCATCRAEAESLMSVARLLPHADPAQFGPAPQPPPELGKRIAATIGSERRTQRRQRRRRFSLGFAGAAAAAAAVVLAIVVLGGGEAGEPEQHVAFNSLPKGVKIGATLQPQAFGTEIHMYVKGIRSGTLCRVYMRGPDGRDVSAGTFRYRWGGDSDATLSAALDLSRAEALVVHAGNRTFVAPLDRDATTYRNSPQEEETT
ncbi:MAG TPA: zf-HC2 domain-containing protein [Solirubrobacterales bacterium]|nr:zf-HC2 domain-containing protein [Solirubrobacterales bacterium]